MNIRQAREADAVAIAEIWNPLIRETDVTFTTDEKSRGDIAAMIKERGAFLVAEADGQVQGFATYAQFRGGVGYRYTMEHTLILNRWARGQGFGRSLLLALEDEARRAGTRTMVAGVSGTNAPALAFHAAFGYRPGGVIEGAGWKFGQWLDLHLLQKRLVGAP